MKYSFIIFLLLFASDFSIPTHAQTIPFQNFTVKNGLPSNSVFDIEQDLQGYLWLATQVGVVKFDGYNFKTYTIKDGLPDNNIEDVYVDLHNNIWLATEGGGIAIFKNNRFVILNTNNGLVGNSGNSIFSDHNNNIWYTAAEGISLIKSDTIINFNQENSPIKSEINCSYVSIDGKVWVSTIDGVYFFDKEFQPYNNGNLQNVTVRDITEDYYGSFWFATEEKGTIHIVNNDVKYFNTETGIAGDITLSVCALDSNEVLISSYQRGGIFLIKDNVVVKKWLKNIEDFGILQINRDSRNRIWARTAQNGIILLINDNFKIYSAENNLIDNRLTKIYEDNNGNIWLPTWNGLSKYGKTVFEIYNQDLLENEKNVLSIASRGDNILIGTYSGLNIISKEDQINYYTSADGLPEVLGIHTMYVNNNDVWLGTAGGLSLFKNDKIIHFSCDLISIDEFITDIVMSNDNVLYTATKNGIITLSGHKYRKLEIENSKPVNNSISVLAFDLKNNLWCGTTEGLSVFDGSIFHNYDTTNGLPNNYCNDISIDNKNNCWLATDKGISRIKLNKDWTIDCKNIDRSDGMVSDLVFLIQVDKKGYIWAGHNKGLEKINPDNLSIIHYGVEEGFLPLETYNGSVTLTDSEDIWFGTVDGAVRYIPANDIQNKEPPKVYITSIKLYNDTTPVIEYADGIDSINNLPVNLRFKHNKNNLIFRYVGLHYTIIEKNRYKYMLEGYDKEWSEATTSIQSIPYRKIPPGKYSFKVIAANCDGIWTEEPASYTFEIKPPFWKTLWFYILEIFAGVVLLVLIIRIRERKLRHDKQVLAQKVKERTIEVETQRDQIAFQKKEITDSIVYAEKIQSAVLPKKEYIDNLLKDYFILFKPRDIVSGDYYWVNGNKDRVIVVAADCTGHGVPGAFMSMLGVSILNEISSSNNLTAGKILDMLREHLTATLRQTGQEEEAKDGMDMALCIIDHKKNKLEYSGAYNPLVLIRNKEIEVYKADKMPVGYHQGEMPPFKTTSIPIKNGDIIYIYSDGYADQFGGPEGKKFKSVNFRNLLLEISGLPLSEQKVRLNETIEDWMGINEQVDDILVVGIKL
ncbi:MAG: SpoIIE family protein phosphatase [Bacteroidales bacterium]|nr:SpoIIE family protein phosphatase [Bacteroidales bacterium]